MTFPSLHSFYVTLLSQDDKDEFPTNQPHRFKNRLPRPIRFVGSDWQVGLVSLSLPNVPAVGETFIAAKDPLLYVRWHERVLDTDDNRLYHQRRELTLLGNQMTQADLLATGQQFFKTLVRRYDQTRAQRVVPQSQLAENNGIKLYPLFEWTQDGDLRLNATNVDYTRQVAKVEWGKLLALKMGWIVEPAPDVFRLGPNIVQEFRTDTIPNPVDVVDALNRPAFWSVDGQYFQLLHELQLALGEFECQVSSHERIRPDAVPVRALRCRHQPDGRQPNHRSFAGNQVSSPRDDSL